MDKELAKNIGRRIAQQRIRLGYTQEEVAELSGLSPQFFACVERGIKNMRAENLLRVSQVLQVSSDYILTGKNTAKDRIDIVTQMESLDERQFCCIKEIIRQYMIACGYKAEAE